VDEVEERAHLNTSHDDYSNKRRSSAVKFTPPQTFVTTFSVDRRMWTRERLSASIAWSFWE
jgi:hypothetical protein